tara:strand:- start:34291 stop:34761 length:471 start_codon:yes stop_codon:yes gene_type:complete
MKIELKNIKTLKAMSEETQCFTATVYIDGSKAGTVRNSGHGGCNEYHPTSLGQRLDDYAKTLPADVVFGMTIQPDADSVIGKVYQREAVKRELTSLMARKIVFIRDGEMRSIKCDSTVQRDTWLASPQLPGLVKGGAILNLMPLDDAAALAETCGL